MKHCLSYIMWLYLLFCAGFVSCAKEEFPGPPLPQNENTQKVMARVVVPGKGTDEITTENLNIETVRFLLFNNETGLFLQKTSPISVTLDMVTIDTNKSPHQYVINVEADLTVKKEMANSATYLVYAILNEEMGGNITGVTSTNISNRLDNINHVSDLVKLMSEPLPFTFDANNVIDPKADEPTFIMYGSGTLTNLAGTSDTPLNIVIDESGLDRSMAKVTIESISSNGNYSYEISKLFITGIAFENLPKSISIDKDYSTMPEYHDIEDTNLSDNTNLFANGFFTREGGGDFQVDVNYTATLKQTFAGLFWQSDKLTGQGSKQYTVFGPEYKGDGFTDEITNTYRGKATLFTGNNLPESLQINEGNYPAFFKSLDPALIGSLTTPYLEKFEPVPVVKVNPTPWSLSIGSYYIPENKTINKTYLIIDVSIGEPLIKTPSADSEEFNDIKQECLDNWNATDDDWEFIEGDNPNTFYKRLWKTEGNTDYYWYVNDNISASVTQRVTGTLENYFKGKEFVLSNDSKTKRFRIPVASSVGGDAESVYRNHEYKLTIEANTDTYNSILNNPITANRSRTEGKVMIGQISEDGITLTVYREVTPFN